VCKLLVQRVDFKSGGDFFNILGHVLHLSNGVKRNVGRHHRHPGRGYVHRARSLGGVVVVVVVIVVNCSRGASSGSHGKLGQILLVVTEQQDRGVGNVPNGLVGWPMFRFYVRRT